MGSILREWERSVAAGRSVLRNTCIATYYMERCAEREQLEALQARLLLFVLCAYWQCWCCVHLTRGGLLMASFVCFLAKYSWCRCLPGEPV